MIRKPRRASYVLVSLCGFAIYALMGRRKRAQEWLFGRLYLLGGIYIKFLQLLAIREDANALRSKNLANVFMAYDQVGYEPINIQGLLRSELGESAQRLQLESIEPFAAGSFGQVYGATLDGRPVVIKVLRPSVAYYLRFDLKLLLIVAKLISVLQPRGIIDVQNLFVQFKQVTLQEIDYKHEVETANNLASQLQSNKVIYIPKTYAELSTAHIIVQERVLGLPLTTLLASEVADKPEFVHRTLNTNLEYVLEELAVELIGGSLTGNGTHGDPHPGNIYLMSDNRVALIDFGINATVPTRQPELIQLLTQYVATYRGEFDPHKFSQAMIAYYVPELIESLQTLSYYFGHEDLMTQVLQEIGTSAAKSLNDHAQDQNVASALTQFKMHKVFSEVMNKDNRFGLHVTLETPAFLRSGQIFLNLVGLLGCDKQLLRKAYERVIDMNSDQQPIQTGSYDAVSIDQSMHAMANWFDRLHHSDPNLYNRLMTTWKAT